jgi:hypothetical protein
MFRGALAVVAANRGRESQRGSWCIVSYHDQLETVILSVPITDGKVKRLPDNRRWKQTVCLIGFFLGVCHET